MTDNEKLIKEAAEAIREVRKEHLREGGSGDAYGSDDLARAAFAVFEKAHAPTCDERVTVDVESLDRSWGTLDQRLAGTILAVIAHYGPKWREASGGDQANEIARALQAAGFHRSEVPEPPSREAWRESIVDERCQQPSKGYTSYHDREHGVDHLFEWAQEYARIGEPLKSAALIEAARDLHRAAEVPERSAAWHDVAAFLESKGMADGGIADFIRENAPEPQGESSDAQVDERGRHWWACAVNAPRADWVGPCDCDLSRDPSLAEHPAALRAAGGAQ